MRRLSYPLLCILLGLALGWMPILVHGPIPEKWTYYHLAGGIMVWGWYVARLLIGLLVGITVLPRAWWLRGPLCGLLAMVPLGFVSLGNPLCGGPCLAWNWSTGAVIGFSVAGLAWAITGLNHHFDRSSLEQ